MQIIKRTLRAQIATLCFLGILSTSCWAAVPRIVSFGPSLRYVGVHGTYSFHFVDRDGNDWEILSNPKGGYTWIFEKGDMDGKGHFEKGFRHQRPDAK